MNWKILPRRSFKTRLSLFTLAIFLISIWSLSYYASHELRQDMQLLLRDEQRSTAAIVADSVNDDLKLRFVALHDVAATLTKLVGDNAVLQSELEEHAALQTLFNDGVFVTGSDGTAIAAVPLATGRLGVKLGDRDHVAAALQEGRATIGAPLPGKTRGVPSVGMTVPIRDARGKVIGALSGNIDLGMPSFLDLIADNRFGQRGELLLIAPLLRVVVTASNRRHVMEALPAPGVSSLLDRRMQGYEGTEIFVDPLGVEVLSTAKKIPLAGWYLAAVSPTAEVFAPVYDLQWRMLSATLLLSLAAGTFVWMMLHRELTPMTDAVRQLAAMTSRKKPIQALAVANGEFGAVVDGVNDLLQVIEKNEISLRQSEQRYRSLFNNAAIAMFQSRPDGSAMLDCNDKFLELVGSNRDEVIGAPSAVLWQDQGQRQEMLRRLEAEGQVTDLEFELLNTQGEVRHCLTSLRLYREEDLLEGSIQDISKRKQAEEALREQADRLRALSGRVLEAQETERRRLAIELHDELGQALTAIKFNMLARERSQDRSPAEQNAADLGIVEDALQQVRRLALALRPSMLDDLGLVPALRWIVEQTMARGNLDIQLRASDFQARFKPEIETACFRIVQESLTNIVRHAQARQVRIDLFQDGRTLVLCIADDGCGFDPGAAQRRALVGENMGLLGMQERAALVGGRLTVDSAPGRGCTVRLRCPLTLRGEAE